MLPHIRYRYALPLLVTLAGLCLLLASTRHQSQRNSHVTRHNTQDGSGQTTEQGGAVAITLPADPKWDLIFKAEMVLNLPAVFVAIPIEAFIFEKGSDTSLIGITTLLAPFLWYWIGKWVDRQLGFVKQKPDRARSRMARTILRVLAYTFLALCVLSFTPFNPTPSPDSKFLFATLALWLLGYLFCSYWGGRRALQALSS
jgi:hypothetical protein